MAHLFGEEQIQYLHERFVAAEGHDPDLDLVLFGTQHLLGFVWACRPEGLEAAQRRLLERFNAQVTKTAGGSLVVEFVTCFAFLVGEVLLYAEEDLREVTVAAHVLCLYASVPRRPKGMSDVEVLEHFDCSVLHGTDSPDILAVSVSLFKIDVEGAASGTSLVQ